jgi:hypothetical protein
VRGGVLCQPSGRSAGEIALPAADVHLLGIEDDLNLYAYVGNDPLDRTDPSGLRCSGTGDQAKCTIDLLNGQAFDRDATKKANPKLEAKIERLEGNLTKSYMAAQKLGDGTITVKGDAAHGIADTPVTGARIADEMHEAAFNAETRPEMQAHAPPGAPPGASVLATADRSTHTVNYFNSLLNQPLSARGNFNQEGAGVHEAMHFIPRLGGWLQRGEMEHQAPFEQAIEQLLGPRPQ